MSGGQRPLGYTIVEVMIVLAVSGVMFGIAASFINGKQAGTSFRSGVNEFASRMQSVIDSVASGQYTDIPVSCTAGAELNFSSTGATINQGQNAPCTFLGKVVHLREGGFADKYEVFLMAGRRQTSAGGLVTTLAESTPKAVYTNSFNPTTQGIIPQGLVVEKFTLYTASGGVQINDYPTFGVVQGFGSASATASGSYASGGQTLSLVYAARVLGGNDEPTARGNLTSPSTLLPSLDYAKGVKICISDKIGGGTRFAEVSIGSGDYSQLNVKTTMGVTSCS